MRASVLARTRAIRGESGNEQRELAKEPVAPHLDVQVAALDDHRPVQHDEHAEPRVARLRQDLARRHVGHTTGGHDRGGLLADRGEEGIPKISESPMAPVVPGWAHAGGAATTLRTRGNRLGEAAPDPAESCLGTPPGLPRPTYAPARENAHMHAPTTLTALAAAVLAASIATACPAVAAPPDCFGQKATVIGTDGPDRLAGTAGPDVIVGLGGNDRISGLGGDDLLCGGAGQDVVAGDAGNDKIALGSNPKVYYDDEDGRHERAELGAGGDGDDLLAGGSGFDRLDGGTGNDVLRAGTGDDETLTTPDVNGGEGDDRIYGGPGNDFMSGGPGDDLVLAGDGNDVITEDAGPLVGGYGTDTMGGQGGNDRLTTTGGQDRLVGDDGDDHLTGSPEADHLEGGGGADWVSAGDGDDIVIGGAGSDTFSAGDSLEPRDTVVDLAAETAVGYGTDVVESFENAVAQPNGGTDVLRGTLRDNVFSGLGAGDSVDGLLGTDTLDLTESIDSPYQRTGWLVDLGTGTAWLGTTQVGLLSIENVNGSSGADRLLGSDGPNVLRGLGRADVLRGRGGDDVLVGGKGDDTVAGGAGRDRCTSPTRRQGATGCELP